jgi:hypothetical protein
VESRSSSKRTLIGGLLLAFALPLAGGCVTVKPEDKEFLAEPAMTFGSGGEARAQEEHVLSNREGSFGAGSASGGGCGCN